MKVSKLMSRDVRTCLPSDPMSRAAEIMWERDCGCVPVVALDGRLVGMITDRDACMAAYTRGRSLEAMKVEQGMSDAPSVCRTDENVDDALRTMAARQVHRLPVVDEHQKLAGMLSLSDVVRGFEAKEAVERRRSAEDVLNTLAAVTRPRRIEAAAASTSSVKSGSRSAARARP